MTGGRSAGSVAGGASTGTAGGTRAAGTRRRVPGRCSGQPRSAPAASSRSSLFTGRSGRRPGTAARSRPGDPYSAFGSTGASAASAALGSGRGLPAFALARLAARFSLGASAFFAGAGAAAAFTGAGAAAVVAA